MSVVAENVLRGLQRPRVASIPPFSTSQGQDAVGLAADVGLHLDDWQAWCLEQMLGEAAGKWASFECAVTVGRQNGKGSILEARELFGLFLGGERLILHTAHEFKTAAEGFLRIKTLIDNCDWMRAEVKAIRTSHGEEAIELLNGSRLRFVARSTGSGRGFSGDLVILDEAYALQPEAMAALLPTLSARPNPQLLYTSSAPMLSSSVLRSLRERGHAGGDPSLCYLEWSAPEDADLDDRAAWAQANPALGIRINEQFIERERRALGAVEFARERLGIPDRSGGDAVIAAEQWERLEDKSSEPRDPVCFAVDVTPDRSRASICLAGARLDGLPHVEMVDNKPGTDWIVERLVELNAKWKPALIVLDQASPAGSLLPDLAQHGLEVTTEPDKKRGVLTMTGQKYAQACGSFYDAVAGGKLKHLGTLQPPLIAAVDAGRKRPLGDSWAWHRRDSSADITPLVGCTLALYGHRIASAKPRRRTLAVGY